jgi:5-dehydro-4-deoxyglucarate dehydratase
MKFDGVLFFPVTPFTAEGAVDVELLKDTSAPASRSGQAASSPPAAPANSTPSASRRSAPW